MGHDWRESQKLIELTYKKKTNLIARPSGQSAKVAIRTSIAAEKDVTNSAREIHKVDTYHTCPTGQKTVSPVHVAPHWTWLH